ncbi:MAG: outer membrane receptor for ferrienterochelin and colicin [Janthinobacterium sp.]|jgi:outer membrane receptor for ferrienterochelin and colicin
MCEQRLPAPVSIQWRDVLRVMLSPSLQGLAAMVAIATMPAAAQDLMALSLDQLQNIEVVSASKFPQKASEAPSSVNVITAQEIETTGYRTLADLLLSRSGFYSAGRDVYFPEYDNAASNHGVAVGLDTDRYRRLFAKYTHADLMLEWIFGERSKGIATAAYGQQFNDSRSNSVDRYVAASATYQRVLSATPELAASISFSRYTYTGHYAFGFAPINATLARLKLAPGLASSASIYNLLDKRYADPPSEEYSDNSMPPRYLQSIGQDGREWRIDLRYRF